MFRTRNSALFMLSLIALSCAGAVFFVPASAADTASIFLSPASGTFTVGSTFTVSIYLNTGGQFVNAIEADVNFPPDKLQVVSPTAGKSIVLLWVGQPTYSNIEGTLKFQGVIPSPGINTESGVISTITFRVKSIGTAAISVLDSSRVLLNDGKGTDVLSSRSGAVYTFALPPPAGPIVSSPTNPDQEKWYAGKDAVFRWEAPPDIQGFSYILNDTPVDDPDEISEGLRTAVSYKDLADGVHYFHIKALRSGQAGGWGGVTDYAVKIDTTPPAGFTIEVSPSENTSNHRPIISFITTDAGSGIDHYELKLISLDPQPKDAVAQTPFFIESTSPYAPELNVGRYDVIVQAYDEAGNVTQATRRIEITERVFQFIGKQGVRVGGTYTVPWFVVGINALIVLLGLFFLARAAWRFHRRIEKQLEADPRAHPDIAPHLERLKEKQGEYGKGDDPGALKMLWFLLLVGASMLFAVQVRAAGITPQVPIEPPVVSLFPTTLSNDEILYIGGRSGAPGAEVIIYLQNTDSGSTESETAVTDKDGAWFYSFQQFLSAGRYVAWTQLKIGEEMSPPSSRLDLTVGRTAIQVGDKRFSYERLYFLISVFFLALLFLLLGFVTYHFSHAHAKRQKLLARIREVEESVRRGFVVLRRDIEAELATIHQVKMSKELSREEKEHEEKLLRDLEAVNNYIGKEVWEIDREESGG